MAKGWPLDKEDTSGPEFIPSTIDIPIAEGEENQYIKKLVMAVIPSLVPVTLKSMSPK